MEFKGVQKSECYESNKLFALHMFSNVFQQVSEYFVKKLGLLDDSRGIFYSDLYVTVHIFMFVDFFVSVVLPIVVYEALLYSQCVAAGAFNIPKCNS